MLTSDFVFPLDTGGAPPERLAPLARPDPLEPRRKFHMVSWLYNKVSISPRSHLGDAPAGWGGLIMLDSHEQRGEFAKMFRKSRTTTKS